MSHLRKLHYVIKARGLAVSFYFLGKLIWCTNINLNISFPSSNLGSWFDAQMRINIHIGKTCSKAFHGLYKIREIRKFLNVNTTKTLVMHLYPLTLNTATPFSLANLNINSIAFRKSKTQQLELFFNCLSSTT